MTHRNHRFIPLTFAILLLVGLLQACAGLPFPLTTGRPAAQPQPSQSPTAVLPKVTHTALVTQTPVIPTELQIDQASLNGLRIVFLHPFTGDMADLYESLAQEFSRTNPWGVLVQAQSTGGLTPFEEIMAATEPEQLPQVLLASGPLVNGLYADGRLVPLNVYLDSQDFALEGGLDGFIEAYRTELQHAEQQAGLPALRSAFGLFYNQTWAKELGFSAAPKTTAEFRAQVCAAAQESNRSIYMERRGTGGWLVDTSPSTALAWMTAFDANFLNEAGDYRFNTPQAGASLTFLRKLQEEGCVWIGKRPIPQEYFADRFALVVSASMQDMVYQQRLLNDMEVADEWQFIPYPQESGAPDYLSEGYAYGLVKHDARQQLGGWLFMRWLSTPAVQQQLMNTYPSLAVQTGLTVSRAAFPWSHIAAPLDRSVTLPAREDWLVARRPVEDAFWQLFQLASADQVNLLLPELDRMIGELIVK